MEANTPVGIVQAWQAALNRGDAQAVLQYSHPDIEIVGPRGSGMGHQLLSTWLQQTQVQLHPRRTFAQGDRVVVLQDGIWRSPEDGTLIGEAQVASVFRVRDTRVAYYARYDDLTTALTQAELTETDEVA